MSKIDLGKFGIDSDLSLSILSRFNSREIGQEPKAALKEIPQIDNESIIDFTKEVKLDLNKEDIEIFCNKYDIPNEVLKICESENYKLNDVILNKIGIYLYPKFAYGVLNGGSATSYVDNKKNRDFSPELFNKYSDLFNDLSTSYKGKAKGITPGFINPNGEPGPTFMELKMRDLLLKAKEYKKETGNSPKNLFPMFQMTSTSNTDQINNFYRECKDSPYLKDLISETEINITEVLTGVQPLITAYSHSDEGDNKSIFLDKKNNPLPLPGGHGQCFLVLKDIFLNLYNSGIRFVTIGNVDNIGYTLDPKSLALLALTGKQAAFDFSFKTEFDVKGGILIKDQFDRINCADLGVAVSKEDLEEAINKNIPILFNCATGMFNLEYLINNLDMIISRLPTRFSDQNKDAGKYSQAEQVTWEIIGLLDNFLVLAIDKYDRFLASKLLLENLVTSGLTCDDLNPSLKECGEALNSGLFKKLKNSFKLELKNGKWC